MSSLVLSPQSAALDHLCQRLARSANDRQTVSDWPAEALQWCADAGVYRWFLPKSVGGLEWDVEDQTRGYLRLAAADLTTTFVITQAIGACRRIAGSPNSSVADEWLPRLLQGTAHPTVGISHLTTSRQHLREPVLRAEASGSGFRLSGFSPWVTAAPYADLFVVGATLPSGEQLLAAIPADADGVKPSPGTSLVALSASCTARVDFDNVFVQTEQVLAGPIENVMQGGTGGMTGGIQTSALAIGLAKAAVEFLNIESERREDLQDIAGRMLEDVQQVEATLLSAAGGNPACDLAELRGEANRLVLRATQAALMSAKGAGYVVGHPVGRWCQEALFFLVWSCPQPVAQSHLCELAGLS